MLDRVASREGAELVDHRLAPRLGLARMLLALGHPDALLGEDRRGDVQARQLVGATGVVGVGRDALTFEHLAQADAAALVLDQQHVGLASRRARLVGSE